MRAIASARILAAEAGTQLVVLWTIDDDLGARYEDLFVQDNSFAVVNVSPHESLRDKVMFLSYGEIARVKFVPTGWITPLIFGGRVLRNLQPVDYSRDELKRIVTSGPRTLISSWWEFLRGSDFSFFRPHLAAQAEIEAIAEKFVASTIGVHIRRTDNVNAIRYSPTSAFEAAMAEVLEYDPSTIFFLTTDCPETEAMILDRFRKNVITRQRQGRRNSTDGMRDAVIDLFLLSRTSQIWGSYYSTFSETAASLGGIKWVTVTHDASLKCSSDILVPTKCTLAGY